MEVISCNEDVPKSRSIALVAIALFLVNIDSVGAPEHGNLPSRINC